MPTHVWGEEWWKSNQFHDLMTSHIVAIAPPEPQIEILQNSYTVVKDNYMSLNCESTKAPCKPAPVTPDAVLSQKALCHSWKKIATEHIWFSFFTIFREGKSFETFKSHIPWVLPIFQLKPTAKYALSVVGLRALICSLCQTKLL